MTTARQLLNGDIDISNSFKPAQDIKKNIANDAKSEKAKAIRRDTVYTKHYPLGAKLAQCCGGSVTVMFESFNVTPPMSLLVFGAGHVAAALMTILAELPCQVDWVDSRPEMFAPYLLDDAAAVEQQVSYQLPAHICPHISEEPVDFVRPFIANSSKNGSVKDTQRLILVMTHNHNLDFELVRAALDVILENSIAVGNLDNDSAITNNDSAKYPELFQVSMPYIGCIGSATKAKRFKDRLLQRGYTQQIVDKLTMPIGIEIGGKEPMAVAVSTVAQILQHYHNYNHSHNHNHA